MSDYVLFSIDLLGEQQKGTSEGLFLTMWCYFLCLM